MTPNFAKKIYFLIFNPISGDIDKADIVFQTFAYAKLFDIEIIVYQTTGIKDADAIIELFKKHEPERILIAGGDGTVKLVAEALEHFDVIFGILPAGSANGLATDLNLPETISENLSIAFHNNFMEMDMVSINGIKSLHLSDLGLNAVLVKNYENSTTRGKLGYALQIIPTLLEFEEPFSITIEANGTTVEYKAAMVVVANSQKYGTGVIINPNGKMNDGKFEIVIFKNLDIIVFAKIITGNMPVNDEDIEIISTECAVITSNLPVSFQIDGEYIGEETQLDIKILPAQMKIAIPDFFDENLLEL